MSRAYRQRLALEWRAAVLVAALAVAVAVLAFTRLVDATWLLVVVGAVLVLIAVGLMLLSYFRPVSPPPVPGRWRDRDVTEAQIRVRRGEPVEPPELQAATIATLRRGLRISLLQFGLVFPMLGCSWALRLGEPGFAGGFAYVGIAVMLLAIGGLAWSGVVQTRLDRLEGLSGKAAIPATEGADGEPA